MKLHAATLIFSTALIAVITVTCNKPQDVSNTSKLNSTLNAEVKDEEVTSRVKLALLNDKIVSDFDVAVATLKGDVRLTGFVDDQSQIDYIHQLVRSAKGVHSIHDELSIKQ